METNIHHPSHYFRKTAIAAIVASLLSPSAYAVVVGQNATDAYGTLTGTTFVSPTSAIVGVSDKNVTLGVSNTANIVNNFGQVTSTPSSSIILDGSTGNINSVAASGATNVLSVTGGGSVTASAGNVTIAGNAINLNTPTVTTTGSLAVGNNLSATNTISSNSLSATNGAITNLNTSNLGATGGSATGLSNLGSTNGTITNLGATRLNVSGQSIMSGINNSGALSNTGTLTNVGNTTLTGATNTISTTGGGSLTTNAAGVAIAGNTISLKNDTGHGLNISSTTTTLTGGTNSSVIAATDGSATMSVGTATTPPVMVVNASNTNGNTSFTLNSAGTTALTSVLTAPTQGTSGNISSFTRDGVTVPQTTDNKLVNGTTVPGTTVSESVSSLLLTNGNNVTNGIQVFENRTNIVGPDINFYGNTTLGNTSFQGGSTVNFSNTTVIGLNSNVTLTQIRGAAEPFASNGVNGTASLLDTNAGAGAMTTFSSTGVQTVAANTTIGDRLVGAKYQNLVNGNELIDGNLYVNGDTALVGTHSATSTVDASKNLASSKLAGATTGVIGQTGTVTTGTSVIDPTTGVAAPAPESVASTTLTNGYGLTNGLKVYEDRTTLSGGAQQPSTITISDGGISIQGGLPGTTASNGVTGITATDPGASIGSGAVTLFGSDRVQTIAPGTTIGDRLNGVKFQTALSGNSLVDGNLYVNGDTNFVGKTAATSTVVGDSGTSKLGPAGVTGQTGITTSSVANPVPVVDIATGKTANESVASTTLTNGLGKTNGLQVFEDRTNLTGGTQQPSSLTLNDNGVTFGNSTGGPAKVTGVADGTSKFDAVNYGQLQALSNNMDGIAARAYSGIAQSAAMNSIPTSMAGHHYGIGIGSGFYSGQQAIAFGGGADVGEHIKVKAAVANGFGTSSAMTANVGAGFSW